ncbi:MAG: hypothetical protein ACYTHM_04375 [Planctomycetota bacterium]
MLDRSFVLKHPEIVVSSAAKKGFRVDVEGLRKVAQERRVLARRRSELGRRINELGVSGEPTPLERTLARRLRGETAAVDAALEKAEAEERRALLQLPNLPDPEVPEGDRDRADLETFPDPPGVSSGWDGESGRKGGGRGSVVWRGEAGVHEDRLTRRFIEAFAERGYALVVGGPVVTREALVWAGYLPAWEDRLVAVGKGLFLAPRPEPLLLSLHAGKTLHAGLLPLSYVSAGWCYRPHGRSRGGRKRRPVQYRAVDILRIEKPGGGRGALDALVRVVVAVHEALEVRVRPVERPVSRLSFSASSSVDILAQGPGGAQGRTCTVTRYGDFLSRRAGTRFQQGPPPEMLSAAIAIPVVMRMAAEADG